MNLNAKCFLWTLVGWFISVVYLDVFCLYFELFRLVFLLYPVFAGCIVNIHSTTLWRLMFYSTLLSPSHIVYVRF